MAIERVSAAMHSPPCCIAALSVARRGERAMLGVKSRGGAIRHSRTRNRSVIFATFIARLQDRLEKRRRYQRLVAEIMDLSEREIADLQGDRSEMIRYARWRVYTSA
jgi:cell division protein FtsB